MWVPEAFLRGAMVRDCSNGADRKLLIDVSNLSCDFRYVMDVKNRRNTMRLCAGAAMLALAAALTTLAPPPLRADEHGRDEVRHAVDRGEIRSLADVLAAIRGKLPGEIAGVEIERENGRWLYEFRVIDDQGRLFEVYVDARTAIIERTKEK